MIRRLLTVPAILVSMAAIQPAMAQEEPVRSIAQSPILALPIAPMPSPEHLVDPPHETDTWPIRPDGQADQLWDDNTVNLTDWLNRYYYNPKWRGEVWAPFHMYWISERATRMMSTWPEYDEFSIFRRFNRVHKILEHYSGFD